MRMQPSTRPVEILDQTIAMMLFSSRYRPRHGKPGEVIQGLSEERRAILRGLRSDDIGPGHRRDDLLWFGHGVEQNDRFRSDRLAFDRKLLRRS